VLVLRDGYATYYVSILASGQPQRRWLTSGRVIEGVAGAL
jgi:hypothetical protein